MSRMNNPQIPESGPVRYCRLGDRHLFSFEYVYIDSDEYLADDLFIRHGVNVRYGAEYGHPKHPGYRIIHCHIEKQDEEEFRKALDELESKMLITGHDGYDKMCDFFGAMLRAGKSIKGV